MDDGEEFEDAALESTDNLARASVRERVAVACRGSANPAALAWIAEGVEIIDDTVVIDLGAGMGGPAAWISQRYGCRVLGLEPGNAVARGMHHLFGLGVVRADVLHAPLRDDCADVALLLGVLSVVPEPLTALSEARRTTSRLGLLDYCANGSNAVEAGGSRFLARPELDALVREAGWEIGAAVDIDLPSPPSWDRAIAEFGSTDSSGDEDAVRSAIEQGDIAPRMLIAS